MNQDERFLVTGSDGCIGSWVVAELARAGRPVVAADLTTDGRRVRRILEPELVERVAFAICDVTAPGAIERTAAEHGVTRIVHLAALQMPFVAADPIRGAEVNVVGTMRALEAARTLDAVRGIAYASSTAALGSADSHLPDTLYGVLKACNEECARLYARDYGTPSVGLRPCVVFGPNRDQGLTAAMTHALRAAALGKPYAIPFGGAVDLQYARDVAWAFIGAALAEPEGAPVFDLRGELIEVADFVALLEEEAPDAAGLVTYGQDPMPGRLDLDDSGLAELAGEQRRTPLREAVRETLDFFRRSACADYDEKVGFIP